MKLSLVIRKNGKVIYADVLTEVERCCRKIVPKREPVLTEQGDKVWTVALEKRRAFAKATDKALTDYQKMVDEYNSDNALAFFALVRCGRQWGDDATVDWLLILGERELAVGEEITIK